VRDWDDILVAECSPRPEVLGKSIAEIAVGDGQGPLQTLVDLITVSEGQAVGVFFDQLEANVRALMRHPTVAIGSDGQALAPDGILGQRRSHPRCYGTFPRVLGHYVRDEQLLSLEEGVRKMTGLTAERLGLRDRGVVREGSRADLVLFDAATIADRATYAEPHLYPAGIHGVMVNGVMVVEQGEHSGSLPGRVLRGPG
jgi:N-acyl-D-aspartate/D-glutamate deacylase